MIQSGTCQAQYYYIGLVESHGTPFWTGGQLQLECGLAWGSSGLRKDALLWRRDEGGLGSPHARVYGKWPPDDARRVAPG